MRTRLAAFATAVVASFGIAYVVGEAIDPIVEDDTEHEDPAHEEPTPTTPTTPTTGGGFGHDHSEHAP